MHILDAESAALVSGAEGAFIVGTSQSNLEDETFGLARRPDDDALILHKNILPELTSVDKQGTTLIPSFIADVESG
jgi:hypothetical protein